MDDKHGPDEDAIPLGPDEGITIGKVVPAAKRSSVDTALTENISAPDDTQGHGGKVFAHEQPDPDDVVKRTG